MAKRSKIAADARRREVVARYAERRAELKRIVASPSSTPEERATAVAELAAQPRDASRTRLRNRDVVDERPRAYLRRFGLSRIRLRELAHRGELPGVTKSSW
jgi:small subunit ribosomal protein S14